MIVQNIAYLYAIQLLRLMLPLALLSILTKVLTSTQYSVYIYTLGCAAWLSMLIEYGFNVSATRRLASSSKPSEVLDIILQTQSARLLLVAVSAIFLAWAIFSSSVFISYPEWALCAWFLGVMTGLTPTYYYQAMSKLKLVALLEVIGGILSVFSVVFIIRSSEDFWWLGVVLVVIRLIIWRVLERQMYKIHFLHWGKLFRLQLGFHALKDGWKFF